MSSNIDPYFTLGFGFAGLAAPTIAEPTADGRNLNLGFGARGELAVVEFGVGGGTYHLTSDFDGVRATTMDMTTDLKIQPTIDRFEPYALVGLGGHVLLTSTDRPAADTGVGGSSRFGLGVDVRMTDNFALSARYLHSRYRFITDSNTELPSRAKSDSVGINATFYF